MTDANLAQLPEKLFKLLSPLSSEERKRVVAATLILCGDDGVAATAIQGGVPPIPPAPPKNDPSTFLDEKDPQNKGETLAVAVRYRELFENAETHTKAEIKSVVTSARRNFDDHNFNRDLNNAKRQSGYFNLGDEIQLSYYGQQYVDALPDRAAASAIRKPKVGTKRSSGKKKAKKKT